METPIQLKLLNNNAKVPQFQSEGAAGMDLHYCGPDITVWAGQRVLLETGIAVQLPIGYEAQIRPRSGLALKHGLTVLNSPGTIDSDYRGEIKVLLIHHGDQSIVIKDGDRIAQMVIGKVFQFPIEVVESLDPTHRGEGGFGSTGLVDTVTHRTL